MGRYHSETEFWWLLHKKTLFALGKWKMVFPCDEKENFLLQHCSPYQCPHACIIWAHHHKLCRDSAHNIGPLYLESHETSNMIGHFVKVISRHDQYTKSGIFPFNYVT